MVLLLLEHGSLPLKELLRRPTRIFPSPSSAGRDPFLWFRHHTLNDLTLDGLKVRVLQESIVKLLEKLALLVLLDEAALNSKSLLGHLLTTIVVVLLGLAHITNLVLTLLELPYLELPSLQRQFALLQQRPLALD